MRFENRSHDALRTVTLTPAANRYAEGSCLIEAGFTKVLCTASVEEKVPPFLRNSGKGWVTAEYGMLPRATHQRMDREANKGRTGRTYEVQRLIGRSLRSVVDMQLLGERQIRIDCDVLQADGGTRTAAITGSFVALYLSCQKLIEKGLLKTMPITDHVAAISVGIKDDVPLLDLDYEEDSTAETDANFVMTAKGGIVEVQATAEGCPFSKHQYDQMYDLARKGIQELIHKQTQVIYTKLKF